MPYIAGDPPNNLASWQRGDNVPASQGVAVAASSFSVFPLTPDGGYFEGNITGNTMAFCISYNFTNTSGNPTAVWTSTFRAGIYTRTGSTLSLLNSLSGTWQNPAATSNCSTLFQGARLVTMHSSAWSSQPVFTEDGQYWMALQFVPTATTTAISVMQANVGISTLSGLVGVAASTGTQLHPFNVFHGLHSGTTTAVPATLGEADIVGMSSNAFANPWVRIDAGFFP